MRLSEPRIPPLVEEDWTAVERDLLAPIKEARSYVPNIYKTMARHPRMFTPRLDFGRHIQRGSTLPPREREILICRIAWLADGEYEWSAHTRIGRDNGLTGEEIRRIADGPGAEGWNELDGALVRAVDELYEEVFISDATWATLARHYDTHQLMDLVMTVGGYHMLAMALNSFGVQLEEGSEGFPPRVAGVDTPINSPPRGAGGISLRLHQPRISPTPHSEWTEVEAELLAPIREERGYVPNVFGTLTRHPAMYRLWLGFASYILRQSTLPAREREILICRTAWLANGEYEWSAHVRLGREAGLSDEEIQRLVEGPSAPGWGPFDAALVRSVDELHDDTFVSDATWNALAERFDTRQMMDLVLTVGAYNMLAKALNTFGTQLDEGMAGFPAG